jgi:glycosyltransferase involved in cell wall biosynthesis
MNLLLLFDHYYPYIGGAEVVNRNIAEYLSREHAVSVVTRQIKGVKTGIERLNGVKVHRISRMPRLFHSMAAFAGAQRIAKDADIIVSATYASALAGYWLAKQYKKKSVILVHEILAEHWQYFKPYSHFFYKHYERYIVTRPFDCYITFSFYTKRRLMEYGISESRIKVIYHGVDSSIFYPRPVDAALRKSLAGDAPFVYLYFGRPGGSKGLPYLIKAVPEITRSIPGSRLILILSRETKAEYRTIMRLIEETNKKTDTITVIDPVPLANLPDYINIADTVVIPSLSEGFGFSAAESCMMGKKVVVTETGSLPEVVFGRVVKVHKADSHALAQGVIRMFKNDFEVIPSKIFTWEKAFEQYDTVFTGAAQL